MKKNLQKGKKIFLLLPLTLLSFVNVWADYTISGTVLDQKGKPIAGASVALENTIDGTTTDSLGNFKFTTSEKGPQTIVATEVGHENAGMPINITGDVTGIVLRMKSSTHNLDQVVINAGSFDASNNEKTVLKPLDIVTTAGSQADIVRAIQTLPGTQQQGATTGLFVRGGDASEAAMVVDGSIAQNAFFNTAPGVAARSRFSPFQFKGVAFSSGGYSVRYGQALSSILELNTLDLPDKSNVNLGVNMAGVYASGDKLLKNSSLGGSLYYNNLQPFYGIVKSNVEYYEVPNGGGGSAKYLWQPNKDGILKVLFNGSAFSSGVRVPDPNLPGATTTFNIKSQTYYTNVSYKQNFKNKWLLFTTASYSYDKNDIAYGGIPINDHNDRSQFRLEGKRYFNARFSLLAGTETQNFSYYKQFDTGAYKSSFSETQVAGYLEADWTPVYWLAFKPGIRYENSKQMNQDVIAPRISMAIRTSTNSTISLAGGVFYQTPDYTYLFYNNFYGLKMQQAIHYIVNYQLMKNDRILRLEAYYKDYKDLVRKKTLTFDPNPYAILTPLDSINNSGSGYAEGLELFWRDRKSIKNFDYWISYSYINTKRLFKNYLYEATPDFIADHNLNIITKYFVEKWQTSINFTYSYASGRPYYNPSHTDSKTFLSDRAPDFHNLSLTIAYLKTIKKWFSVFYAGIDNITNNQNIFGYRYDAAGNRYEIKPALYRSIFVGVNFSLTEFKKDEL